MTGDTELLTIGLICGAINIPFLAANWAFAAARPSHPLSWFSAAVACFNAAALLGIWADALRGYYGWTI
jgi:hypothetical protein